MPKVCFAPIWYPIDQYATSRLRAKYVAELLADDDFWDVEINYNPDADIAVIVQLCSNQYLELIVNNRDQVVVYDICDRYFATDNVFKTDEGVLHARSRCLEVIERANVLIAPTRQLKMEISRHFPGKPCFYIPELVDYGASPSPATKARSRRLIWFGHTARGNFESARWIIDYLRATYDYTPVIVTTPGTISQRYPTYEPFCIPWSVENIRQELATAELCIVSHAAEEPTKSPNRFVTATMHGVPTLASGSPSCLEILQATGYEMFAVDTVLDLRRAIDLLSDDARRVAYVADLQREMWRRQAPAVVRRAYLELFEKILPGNDNY